MGYLVDMVKDKAQQQHRLERLHDKIRIMDLSRKDEKTHLKLDLQVKIYPWWQGDSTWVEKISLLKLSRWVSSLLRCHHLLHLGRIFRLYISTSSALILPHPR